MEFYKYHGLGNDYLVLDARKYSLPDPSTIKKICHRNTGMGSDGILYGPLKDFELKIFNPDGSEAEKSGNGLRIFVRYLFDQKLVTQEEFKVKTLGGIVSAMVLTQNSIKIDMGEAKLEGPQYIKPKVEKILGYDYHFVSMGNPHCILFGEWTEEMARDLGPKIENDPRFPQRTNVQFAKVLDDKTLKIYIWERGAGYTHASGSSSCAAAFAAHYFKKSASHQTVQMPGGELDITIDGRKVRMIGPVEFIGTCEVDKNYLRMTR